MTDEADGIVSAADHPLLPVPELRVGPLAEGEARFRVDLTTIACFQINAPGFDLDSSFITPEMKRQFGRLAALLDKHEGAPLSIFGHADPSGRDDRNKVLSGRRATAVYALLVRRTDLWEDLFDSQVEGAGDDWNYRHIQIMLQSLTRPSGEPYFVGAATGVEDEPSKQAVSVFQTDNGLEVDGDAGTLTRAALFEQYMEFLCTPPDSSEAFAVEAERFVAAGADAKGKGDFQGCGEFNPFMVLSKQETNELAGGRKQAERAAENAQNRRVLVLFFAKGTRLSADEWPCPRASEGTTGCKKRFFHKGDERRQPTDTRRTFDATQDTFACRFYQRLVFQSPCERPTTAPRSYEFLLQEPRQTLAETESLQLRADDGAFDQTLTSRDGIPSQGGTLLRFSLVRPGKNYTLTHNLGDGGKLTIFAGVPIDNISDFGSDTEAIEPRDPVPPSQPRAIDPPNSDPVLANADESPLTDDPQFHEADPFEDA